MGSSTATNLFDAFIAGSAGWAGINIDAHTLAISSSTTLNEIPAGAAPPQYNPAHTTTLEAPGGGTDPTTIW